MWSQLVLCLLVGLAAANRTPAWKDGQEYVYHVRGRTLASLHGISNQYSGVVLKAKIVIQPKSGGALLAKISDAQFSNVHTQLSEGWESYIPDSELNYRQLPLSQKPFKIDMHEGVVRDIIVENDVSKWEASIIKSIVDQFQLDTQAQNVIPSEGSSLPREDSNSAYYKTMEDTVFGKTETTYSINQMPEYIVEEKPWLAPNRESHEQILEVVKSKNFSRCEERPLYHHGLSGMESFKPSSNQMEQFFIRNAVSRAVITGKLSRYTIQNSVTVNEIVMSPTLNDQQKGSVVSMLNVTLAEVRPKAGEEEELTNPISLNMARPFQTRERRMKQKDTEYINTIRRTRFLRSLHEQQYDSSSSEEERQLLEQPKLQEAPRAPWMPYSSGYKGDSIKTKSDFDVVQVVKKIAQEIGQDLQQHEKIPKQDTLAKFIIMTKLIRIMDEKEIKQVSEQLYSQQEQGHKYTTWVAFRDAVAESGTGPAWLTIQEWIQTKKVQGEDAAEIVSALADSIHEPTEEFIRSFFEFVKKSEVQEQAQLHETSLLSLTNLLCKIYSDKRQSHNEYPVHMFGTFRTEEGKSYVKETIIPYLQQQLQQAISEGNTQKIHLYIRALGNVAHKHILAVFEPYLEGKKQVSQFQRLMMVVALKKLAQVDSTTARSVLFKIYQNPGEAQEIRVTAVYLLMYTNPPSDMLQRMASYTNADNSEYVNAAVKSVIEDAANLHGEQFAHLRSAAKGAQPLLTKKTYGLMHSKSYLRNYVINELQTSYSHNIKTVGSKDSIWPKVFKYTLGTNMGGLKREPINVEAMVSSISDLTDVMFRQTVTYKHVRQQQQSQQTQSEFSSENIARLLNMEGDEREQLEGSLNIQLGSLQKLLSFDNRTIEHLPKMIRELEQSLKQGKHFQYTKLVNTDEIVIAFQTATGLPFVYTFERPILLSVGGKLKASVHPELVSEDKLNRPESIFSDIDLDLVVSTKEQGRLTFVTPFDHQQYSSGYDRKMQLHLPLRGKIQVDVKNMQMETELELEQQKDVQLLHVSTWPYTSQSDILNMQPISMISTTKLIENENHQRHEDVIVGKKETGMAFRVQLTHENKWDWSELYHKVQRNGFVQGLLKWVNEVPMQKTKLDVDYCPQQSTSQKLIIRSGLQQQYHSQPIQGGDDSHVEQELEQLSKSSHSLPLQQRLLRLVGSNIPNSQMVSVHTSVEFQGNNQVRYAFTAAVGKSNVHPKSRVYVFATKTSNNHENKPYVVALRAENHIENTNGLSLDDALKFEPISKTQFEILFGQKTESAEKIRGDIELTRSEERKQYLLAEPVHQQCRRQMQEGNFQLPACANMTIRANLMDQVQINLKFDHHHPQAKKLVEDIVQQISVRYFANIEEDDESRNEIDNNEARIKVKFTPDFEFVGASLKGREQTIKIKNIPVNEWVRQIIVSHPVFHLRTRLMGHALTERTYRPACVVDKTYANTFNNKTYPVSLGQKWHVMLQYIPSVPQISQNQQNNVQEQLKQQLENYVVLVRDDVDRQSEREVKVIIQAPQTKGKVLDITMKPTSQSGSNQRVSVFVNDKIVKISNKESYDVEDGWVQIYALPNGEVKVEVNRAFYILTDGIRVKLTAINGGKLRDSIRGLCGQFNDDKSSDFLTPENYIASNAKTFVESYRIEDNQQRKPVSSRKLFHNGNQVLYANVISDEDAGREYQHQSQMATRHQTRYVQENGHICFTIHPQPVCSEMAQPVGSVTKNVAVHCVEKSNTAYLLKNQIDKGSSLDFSRKTETKKIEMVLPERCRQ